MQLQFRSARPACSRQAASPAAVVLQPPVHATAKLQVLVSQRASSLAGVAPCPAQAWQAFQRSSIVTAAAAVELEVVKEELGPCRRRLNITVPVSTVKQCFHKAVDKMRDVVGDIPGFRRDKIPLSVIITNIGGQRNFKYTCVEEVLLTALPQAMEQVVKEEGVVPDSEQVMSSIKELEQNFDPAKPLAFVVEYDTVPPLNWKQSYKDIEVTIKDTGDFSTDAAAAEQLVRELLKEHGHQRVVVDRGLQPGDTAIVELKFMRKGSKLELPGLSASRTRFDTDIDPLKLAPHLLGIKVGETRMFSITLPDDYRVELWQGMECDVQVTVRELFAWTLPELDDDFVKTYYNDKFASAEELRKSLLATTAMQRVQALDEALGQAVQQAVVECVERPQLPESLVEDMAGTQFRAALLDMVEKKAATPEEAERLATEEMLKEYMEKQRPMLESLCVFNIAVDEIWAKEGLEVDEATIKEEVNLRKQQYEAQKLEYDIEALRDSVVDTFKHLRVVEWLKDNVKRNVLPWQPDAAQPAGTAQ